MANDIYSMWVATATAEGGVYIMQFIVRNGDYYHEPSAANIEAELAKAERGGFPWHFIEPEDLPGTRDFRGAWVSDPQAQTVAVDMDKAIEIHKDALRKVRAPLLQALDIEMMAAWAKGDTKAGLEVEAKKQALRDVTDDPRIEAATTPEELKAVVPDVLSADLAVEAIA